MRQVIIVVLYLAGLICFPLAAQDAPAFTKDSLHCDGMITGLRVVDINDDGRLDFIVSHSFRRFNLKTIRTISIFLQTDEGFPRLPDHSRICSPGDILWDIKDLDNDKIPELLLLRGNGIYIHQWQIDQFSPDPEHLIEDEFLFPGSSEAALPLVPLTIDLEGDGLPEIISLQKESVNIHKLTNSSYKTTFKLYSRPEFNFSLKGRIEYKFSIPQIITARFNIDTIPDLLIINQGILDLFLIHPESAHEEVELRLPDLKYKMQGRDLNPSVFARLAPADIKIETEDLNGDGLIDFVLSKSPNAGFLTGISQVQIFLNRNGRFGILPDQILTADNFSGDHIITDINQDGLMDIAMLTFPLGFTQAARFLLTKRIGNSYEIFLMQSDGTYPKVPDCHIGFTRKVAIDNPLNDRPLRSMKNDFNGDGLADFLIQTDLNEFTVFPGRQNAVFTKKDRFTIKATAKENLLSVDLNRDNRSDLILWNTGEQTGKSLINIILSCQETDR